MPFSAAGVDPNAPYPATQFGAPPVPAPAPPAYTNPYEQMASAQSAPNPYEPPAQPSYGQPAVDPYAPPAPVQSAYGQPASDPYAQPASGQPAYGQPPAPDVPSYGQPASGLPSYGQPASGVPSYGQPASGQPAYGQPSYGQPVSGQPSFAGGAPQAYGQAPFGQPQPAVQPAFFPGQQGPYMPQPPRRSRGGLIAAIIIGVVVLACAGITGLAVLKGSDKPDAVATGSPTYSGSTAGGGVGPTHAATLQSYAVPIPSGTGRWADAKTDENLDLSGVAAFSTDPTSWGKVLTSCNFKDGFVRRWVIDPTSIFVSIRLLRFASSDDAADYLDQYVDANTGDDWGDPVTVPGADGASSFVQSQADKDGYKTALSTGVKGDVVVIVLADQKGTPTRTISDQLLVTQLGRL